MKTREQLSMETRISELNWAIDYRNKLMARRLWLIVTFVHPIRRWLNDFESPIYCATSQRIYRWLYKNNFFMSRLKPEDENISVGLHLTRYYLREQYNKLYPEYAYQYPTGQYERTYAR